MEAGTPFALGRPALVGLRFQHVVDLEHARNVGLGLGERRDAPTAAVHGILACIVSCKRKTHVLAEPVDQKFQIAGARTDVFARIVRIGDAKTRGRRGRLHSGRRASECLLRVPGSTGDPGGSGRG